MASRIKLDLRGLEEVATKQCGDACHEAGEAVADYINSMGIRVDGVPGEYLIPVKIHDDVTTGMRVNRAVTRVVLAHASGLSVQAKHGPLSKGASAAGLRLRGD